MHAYRWADPFVGDREEEAEELLEKIDRVPGVSIAFLLDERSSRPPLHLYSPAYLQSYLYSTY